eukprot:SAG22_NODE_794_length_7157_cov_3.169453_1_plen_312_part_00
MRAEQAARAAVRQGMVAVWAKKMQCGVCKEPLSSAAALAGGGGGGGGGGEQHSSSSAAAAAVGAAAGSSQGLLCKIAYSYECGHIFHYRCCEPDADRANDQDCPVCRRPTSVTCQLIAGRVTGTTEHIPLTKESIAVGRELPEEAKDANIVSIKVRGQDGTEVFFKIKRKSALKKLMEVYVQRQGGTPEAFKFIFDGNRIVETATPDDLEMEDDDVIDAILEQRGSDRRIKEAIEPAGVSASGIPQYTWRYRGGLGLGLDTSRRYFGTMAQDLLACGRGDAVVTTAAGWLAVLYGRIDVPFGEVLGLAGCG